MDNYKYKIVEQKKVDGKDIYKVKDEFIKDELFYILEYKTIRYSDWDLEDKIKEKLRKKRGDSKILDFFDEGDFISDKKTFFIIYNEENFPYRNYFKKHNNSNIKNREMEVKDELTLKDISLKDISQLIKDDPKRIKEIKIILESKIPASLLKYKNNYNVKLVVLILKWLINPDGAIGKSLLYLVNRLPKHEKNSLKKLTHSQEFQKLSSKRRALLRYPLYQIVEELIAMFGLPEISVILILIKLLDDLEE